MRFNAHIYTSHQGPPHPFKNSGVVADSLKHPQFDGKVSLRCQQEPQTQGFLGVPTGKNPKDSNLVSVEAMQWVLLYLSICHDKCY
jgi:hypothetical protein